jgi:hypothetical protein
MEPMPRVKGRPNYSINQRFVLRPFSRPQPAQALYQLCALWRNSPFPRKGLFLATLHRQVRGNSCTVSIIFKSATSLLWVLRIDSSNVMVKEGRPPSLSNAHAQTGSKSPWQHKTTESPYFVTTQRQSESMSQCLASGASSRGRM